MNDLADIGVIGLAVMGSNLALNFDDHGYRVAVHNRTPARIDELLGGAGAGRDLVRADTVEDLVAALDRPRRILLMIKAGSPVDDQLETLTPLLDPGDLVIDGGNSLYTDTERRTQTMEAVGLGFLGVGISGGEEGARFGPSLMPGGTREAWQRVAPMLQAVAAKADDGEPCAKYIGPGGSGHYVKMVHNGIEYGDMQVIAEAYDVMTRGLGMTAPEIGVVFAEWNRGRLDSFLVEITAQIMGVADLDDTPLVTKVLDTAEQKGTGAWTVAASVDQLAPATLVAEAVYARILSAAHAERQVAAAAFPEPAGRVHDDAGEVLADLESAVYASKIVSYAQGFMLFTAADREFGWQLDLGTIASLWRNGAIIRSRFLGEITAAYRRRPDLANLMLAPFFAEALRGSVPGLRRTVARAAEAGIPIPAYASALAFFDGYRSSRLPAALIQAQRDAFGHHTYERVDRARGEWFHSDWLDAEQATA